MASLRLYDVRGRLVRLLVDGPLPAEVHRVRWDRITNDGARATSEVYFLHLRSAAGRLTRRFLLLD